MNDVPPAVTPVVSGNSARPAKGPLCSPQSQTALVAMALKIKNTQNGTVNIETLARDLKANAGKPNHEALKAAVMNSLSAEERARLQTALQGSWPSNGAGKTAWGGGGASPAPAQAQTAALPPGASPKPADARVQAWTAAARALDTPGSPPSAQAVQAAKEAGVNLVRSAIKEGRPDLIAQARAAAGGAEAFDRSLKTAGLDPYYVNTTKRILSAAKTGDVKALGDIAAEVDGKLKEGQGRYFNRNRSVAPLLHAANLAKENAAAGKPFDAKAIMAAKQDRPAEDWTLDPADLVKDWMDGASAPAEAKPSIFEAAMIAPFMTVDQMVTGTIRSVGNAMAIAHGPEVSEDGKVKVGTFADGSTKELYRNPLNGEHFWANPWDLNDQVTAEAASGTAGILAFGRPVSVGFRQAAGAEIQLDRSVLGVNGAGRLAREPEFDLIRDHAARHGPELGASSVNAYFDQAMRHMVTGTRFAFRHDGTQKMAYVTRLGPNKFMFTSTTLSGGRIFTHMVVNENYLARIGITLPGGF